MRSNVGKILALGVFVFAMIMSKGCGQQDKCNMHVSMSSNCKTDVSPSPAGSTIHTGGGGSSSSSPTPTPTPSPSPTLGYNYYLYGIDGADGTLIGYNVKTSGALTLIANTPISLPSNIWPGKPAIDPSGKFLFVPDTNTDNRAFYTYAINSTTGALTQVVGSTQTYGGSYVPSVVAVHPSMPYIYACVGQAGSNYIYRYTYDQNGNLSGSTPIVAGTDPAIFAINSDGSALYILNQGVSTISAYTITSSGSLTQIGSNSSCFSATHGGVDLALDPLGRYIYVSDVNGTVYVFGIASGGGLSQNTPLNSYSPAGAGGSVYLATEPTGKYLYVYSDKIYILSIGSGGSLTQLSNSYYINANHDAPGEIIVDPTGSFLFVSDAANSQPASGYTYEYSIQSGGTLNALGSTASLTNPANGAGFFVIAKVAQ